MLKLNGKPFSLNPTPPSIQKLGERLKKLPKDEVYTSGELAKKLAVPEHTITRALQTFPEHYRKWRNRAYWGSAEALKAFEKATAQ